MGKFWGDKRYYSLNYFLRERFGEKVFKISLDGGFSCPNRDGTVSRGGCIFCSEKGSGDFAGSRQNNIEEQFNSIKEVMSKKWKNGKYIAYFQAFTSTYGSPLDLEEKYSEALKQDGVVALAIATRPDCLPDQVLDLLEKINKSVYLWVELGLQTSSDDTAKLINRGYKLQVFEEKLEKLRKRGIDVVVHVIFGLPGETKEDMLNTIKYLSKKDIQGIKLHLLYLVKGTALMDLYSRGEIDFLTKEEYIDLICTAISILPENIVIHRLTGDSPRDLLVEPKWSLRKWEILNSINEELEHRDIYQGKYYL